MKKICLLLLLTTFPLNLFCQQSNEMVLDSFYIYNWNSNFNDWVGNSRWVHTYDANGNLTEFILYHWDSGTNDWVMSNRWIYTFDANGYLTEVIWYQWDSESNEWVNSSRD